MHLPGLRVHQSANKPQPLVAAHLSLIFFFTELGINDGDIINKVAGNMSRSFDVLFHDRCCVFIILPFRISDGSCLCSVLKTQVVGRSAGRRKTHYCRHATSATVTMVLVLIFSVNCVTKKDQVDFVRSKLTQ